MGVLKAGWLTRMIRSKTAVRSAHASTVDLAHAVDERVNAERKLAETVRAGREVNKVANIARQLRQSNNFSARLEQAFGRGEHRRG